MSFEDKGIATEAEKRWPSVYVKSPLLGYMQLVQCWVNTGEDVLLLHLGWGTCLVLTWVFCARESCHPSPSLWESYLSLSTTNACHGHQG